MQHSSKNPASPLVVALAFATVYIVWGSTYFFIRIAVAEIPPFLLGAIRFLAAGVIMLVWCLYKKEKVFDWPGIKHAAVSGLLLLFVATGVVIWVEQFLPSALVAILVSAAPLWFVLLDKKRWSENFHSPNTIVGLLIGFTGVILLFYEKVSASFHGTGHGKELVALFMLILGSVAWAGGSLYSKSKSSHVSASVTTIWQMLAAGLAFLPGAVINGDFNSLHFKDVSANAWYAILFLIVFGSIAAFSAYVWLLQVRPATQVSTYAYVNPVVAVLLGVFFAGENISLLQIAGLFIILGSVLLINLAKYRQAKSAEQKKAA